MLRRQKTYNNNNSILMILILLFSFVFVLSSIDTVSADSSVIYVNDSVGNDSWDGQYAEWLNNTLSGPKKSIKNATGTVTEGGTVNIANGNYTGENNTNILIEKNMTINGQSKEFTIINGTDSAQIFIIQSHITVTIQNLTFANGTVGDEEYIGCGGAIENYGNLTIENNIFTGNLADYGGAIYNEGNLTVKDSVFVENAAYVGGAIDNEGNLNIISSDFTFNSADYGGAIYNDVNMSINSNFINNVATNGGAIYNEGNLTITQSDFKENVAINDREADNCGNGGAIYNTGNLNIDNSDFTDNAAITDTETDYSGNGGAIYNEGNLTVNSSNFTQNAAITDIESDYCGNGGAIYNTGNLTIESSNCTNNMANSEVSGDLGGNGGAIYNTGNLTINYSNFVNNTAFDGGAIYNSGNLTVNESTFTYNIAHTFILATMDNHFKGSTHGGAIYNSYGGILTVSRSTFTNNYAINGDNIETGHSYGGAIQNEGALNVNNTNFINNTATGEGGAIENGFNGILNVTDSIFTGNNAHFGGAINSYLRVDIKSCNFTNNTAIGLNYGYGGAIHAGGTTTINGSFFINNTATTNGGAIDNGGACTINSTSFINNTARGTGIYEGGGAIHHLSVHLPLTIRFSSFFGNTALNGYNIHCSGVATIIDANYNWWGTNNGPQGVISSYGNLNSIPTTWLVLNVTASQSLINNLTNSTITADLNHDNIGDYHDPTLGHVPDGIPVNFTTSLGNVIYPSSTIDGSAQFSFAGLISGVYIVSATVDNQKVNTSVTVDAAPPTIISIDPYSNAKINVINKVITIIFDEKIQTGTSYDNISVTGPSGTVTTTKNITGNVLTLTPTVNYTAGVYSVNIPVNSLTDLLGNELAEEFASSFTVDTVLPTVNASSTGGLFNTSQSVLLTANDNQDLNPVIRYTTDGINWKQFIGSGTVPINNEGTTNLEFYAVDAAGNPSAHTLFIYTIDKTTPAAWANLKSGLYNSNRLVALLINEPGTIYYTLNGSAPNNASNEYKGPITINSTANLKFIAVDLAGNPSAVYTAIYIIDKTAPKIVLTTPKNYATGISRTNTITIKLSEKIKSSINWSKIVLKNKYGKVVPITKWISGNILYIKTTYKRLSYSYYTLYIPASAIKDYAGNNFSAGYSFKFKTGRK